MFSASDDNQQYLYHTPFNMQANPKFKLLGSLLTTKGIALPSGRQIVQRKRRLHSHLLLTSQQSCRIAGRRDEVCHRCLQRTEGNSLLSASRCDVRPREREVALDPFRLTPGQKGNSSIASFSEQSRRQARSQDRLINSRSQPQFDSALAATGYMILSSFATDIDTQTEVPRKPHKP